MSAWDEMELSPAHVAQLELTHGRRFVWCRDNRTVGAYLYRWPDGSQQLVLFRLDQSPMGWAEKQRAKNELLGAEIEAVEIYPAESRLVDTSNTYHLWIPADPQLLRAVGYHERGRVVVVGGGR